MKVEHRLGTWRSYKSFSFGGGVKRHSVNSFGEIVFNEKEELLICLLPAFTKQRVFTSEHWKMEEVNKGTFLFIRGKKLFEIITLEEEDLVLQDICTMEKTFFASILLWKVHIEYNQKPEPAFGMTLWSDSLIKLITIE